jgi:O-antigen/teichoic acid export membrane protein
MAKDTYGVSRLKRALVHFVGGRVIQASARAGLILVLVRVLPVADYGVYMLVVGLSEMMLQIASFGVLPVAQRFLPQMITTLAKISLFRFVSALIGIQISVLCLTTTGVGLGWNQLTPFLGFSPEQIEATKYAVALFFLVPTFRFASEMLEALLEQGKSQIARALMPLGRVSGILLLLAAGSELGLSTVVAIDICVTASCLLLAYRLLYTSLIAHHATDSDNTQIPVNEMSRFAWHMAAVDLLGSTKQPGAIRMALANTLGVIDSGLFAFLQSLERLVSRYLPGTLLRGLVRPMLLSRAFTPGGMAIVEAGAGLLMKTNLLIVASGCIVIGVGGNELVDILSGGKFPQAGLTLLLMFLVMAITAQISVIEMIMQITGQTKTLRATALIAPLALAAVWAFARFGLNVAVLIIAAGAALSNGIQLYVLVRSPTGFSVDWRGLVGTVVTAALAIIAGILLSDWMNSLFPAIAIALALFVGLLLLARPFTTRELKIVERVAGKWAAGFFRRFARTSADATD